MLEPGDIVLCTVERIERTIIFVKIDGEGDGSIIVSEIAPGRIRNLRDYVVPKKRIVCKVLRVSRGNYELSLRRVTPKEKKELMEQQKQEKGYASVIKSVLKEKFESVIKEITKEEKLFDFIEESKNNPKELEKFIGKEDAKKILEILLSQKQKKATLKKKINIKSYESKGIEIIKEIFKSVKDANTKYISAGVYSIEAEAENIKKADQKIQEILKEIEKKAEKLKASFSIKER